MQIKYANEKRTGETTKGRPHDLKKRQRLTDAIRGDRVPLPPSDHVPRVERERRPVYVRGGVARDGAHLPVDLPDVARNAGDLLNREVLVYLLVLVDDDVLGKNLTR